VWGVHNASDAENLYLHLMILISFHNSFYRISMSAIGSIDYELHGLDAVRSTAVAVHRAIQRGHIVE
jgi:hypothetical protein